MTRVEAVARAIDPGPWHEADSLGDPKHYPESLHIAIQRSIRDAGRAIEANDAWQQHKIVCPHVYCGCENDPDETVCFACDQPLIIPDDD